MSASGVCGSSESTYNRDNSTAVAAIWDTHKNAFNALESHAKALFVSSSSDELVARSRILYDHVITRYTSLTSWTGVPSNPASTIYVIDMNGTNGSTTTLILIVISSISLVAVSSYFVIRRRREN